MEVTGRLKLKYDTAKVSEKFQKRDFVLTTDETTQYPQFVSFQLNQDKCELLNNIIVGDEIKVQFNLQGREWNGPQGIKYFNTLQAWRIEKVGAETQALQATQAPQVSEPIAPAQPPVVNSSIADNDDLPF